jgi:hypothetical protein
MPRWRLSLSDITNDARFIRSVARIFGSLNANADAAEHPEVFQHIGLVGVGRRSMAA